MADLRTSVLISKANVAHLRSLVEGPIAADAAWKRARLGKWFCKGCGLCLKVAQPIDVQLEDSELLDQKRHVMVRVYQSGLSLARNDFLQRVFGPNVEDHLWIGKVLDEHGRPISGFSTFKTRDELVFVLGGTESISRRCAQCGFLIYAPIGQRFVNESDLRGRRWAETQFNDILIPRKLAEEINAEKWPSLRVERVKVH